MTINPISSLTIMGGVDKDGKDEPVRYVEIVAGEIVGIVGPTGSGKSTLIDDIEQLAQADTPTGRTILLNGQRPDESIRADPRRKLVAQLSQKMHFLADMTVEEFLCMHARSRGKDESLFSKIVELGNTLTGEPIYPKDHLTSLSGGQSRALMTADIAVISDSPVVLIDEVENAGIKKQEALKLLAGEGKIVVVVTHDPVLALMSSRRIVIRNGAMVNLIDTSHQEQEICTKITNVDNWMLSLRETIRRGDIVEDKI
ncbi:ATP-binding cassette domain-containing protein [Methanosalsum natronophilum]|uniref:ATP-binding cassette domain-containing protein n=1 Tax=Methanosalsum natronophilum TaxID=768733 RepID=A0A424YU79_9EURY|nr:ATP-binding cassette domain-containing protein [Methanosalsum natronophilum]MCS3923619.1 ABC-type lipoprotein export system ATPase subunit [Methanosalsum natronophilum]RQD82511.1 MAG: ATP-binding cassette domain-containing protein [Methanosalsum natronophilum]